MCNNTFGSQLGISLWITNMDTDYSDDDMNSSDREEIKQKRTSPIMIDEALNTPTLMDEISTIVGVKIMAPMVNRKLKVFQESFEAHIKIQNFISVKTLKSHPFEMQNQKQLKIIITALPIDYDQAEILEEIKSQGPNPEHISLLKSRRTEANMSLFLIVMNKINQ
ncbi:hypothetical protein NPIL_346181 [Nephila pilipes]|uniref:Uncharacterized protein n=1 Tax=Nephila pilipes TaxID=299642 RepID=A0A8X6N7W4_NEPPI|nr:hypothetical protein NPIL_346181 [Nephila pilipes]